MDKPETVELLPAYYWNCPECSHVNFGHGIRAELTNEQKAELVSMMDPRDDWQKEGGEFTLCPEMLTNPDDVACEKCGKEYQVEIQTPDD